MGGVFWHWFPAREPELEGHSDGTQYKGECDIQQYPRICMARLNVGKILRGWEMTRERPDTKHTGAATRIGSGEYQHLLLETHSQQAQYKTARHGGYNKGQPGVLRVSLRNERGLHRRGQDDTQGGADGKHAEIECSQGQEAEQRAAEQHRGDGDPHGGGGVLAEDGGDGYEARAAAGDEGGEEEDGGEQEVAEERDGQARGDGEHAQRVGVVRENVPRAVEGRRGGVRDGRADVVHAARERRQRRGWVVVVEDDGGDVDWLRRCRGEREEDEGEDGGGAHGGDGGAEESTGGGGRGKGAERGEVM